MEDSKVKIMTFFDKIVWNLQMTSDSGGRGQLLRQTDKGSLDERGMQSFILFWPKNLKIVFRNASR